VFSFLYPAFLIGAAAVAIPIVLHLLTRDAAPRVPFSAVRFLQRVPSEDSRRRLRELLLLALRVAALLLLAVAFARPFLTNAEALSGAGVTVVALDTSFSMGGPGRFDRARRLARDAAAGARGPVGVIAFSDTAEIVAPVGGTRGEAVAAIDRLQPGFGATRYAAALRLSAEQIVGARGRIVLVTDLQKQGWDVSPEAVLPRGATVEILDVGAPGGNLALTDLRREDGGVVAVVRNSWPKTATSQAILTVEGRRVGALPVVASPDGFSEVRFPMALPRAGVAVVSIHDEEGYTADNVRYLVFDPPAPRTLLAVTVEENASRNIFYLSRALTVDKQAFELATTRVGDVAQMASDRLAGYAAVLLVGTSGLNRRGRELVERYVVNGGRLLITAGVDVEADAPARLFGDIKLRVRVSEMARTVTLAPTDARHPIFRSFGPLVANLGQVRFDRSVSIDEAPGARVLARFSSGEPALLEYERGRGRLLYFASDLNRAWNDFPIHPTFVPFVQEMLRYLTAARGEPPEYVVADVPTGVRPEPGVISLPVLRSESSGAPRFRRAAVNVDARESDPARIAPEQLIASLGRTTDVSDQASGTANEEHEERQRLWQYGLALMLVSLVCESALARRM
jgi:hypothetical protein